MDDLTKEQKTVLCALYKKYLETGKNYFFNSDVLQSSLFPSFTRNSVSDICWALHRKNYLICQKGDNLANKIMLSDKTIIYMENRFKNGLKEVVSFISDLL